MINDYIYIAAMFIGALANYRMKNKINMFACGVGATLGFVKLIDIIVASYI